MRRTSKTAGFTLIELMITLVLAAVLLAWGVPSFQRFMERTTLSSETNTWVGMLNYARNEAITRGEKVTICRSAAPPENCDGSSQCNCGTTATPPNYHTGYLIFTSTDNPVPGVLHFQPGTYGNELLRTGRIDSDRVSIQGNGFGNNAFSFSPDGTLAPEDFSAGGSARHILCVMEQAGNTSTTVSEEGLRGRVVVISPTGRPRVAEFPGDGDACIVGAGSSNAAADGLNE